LEGKGVAFVTYTSRHSAEFAKEAMSNQSLDNNEMINVRWATDDPNPRAVEDFRKKAEEITRQTLEAHLISPEVLNYSTLNSGELVENENPEEHVVKRQKLDTEQVPLTTEPEKAISITVDDKNNIFSSEALQSIKILAHRGPKLVPFNGNFSKKSTKATGLNLIASYSDNDDA